MSILDQKNKVMSNIAALNVINEGLPKFDIKNSFSSINNDTNPVDFLLDLVQSLMGYQELKGNIIDVITRKLPEIESKIKKTLKQDLKGYVSCGVNPSIPAWLRSTGSGVELKLSNIDFFETMKTDPNSDFGFLIFEDVLSGLNSTDFNTFLYSNIDLNKDVYTPNGGSPSPWGLSTTGTDIIDIRFSPVGTTINNVVKINTNVNYDNKSLTDFNNDFIDSITLFGSPNNINGSKILNGIIDNLFGTVSSNIGKTKKQLKKEAEINEVLECILNSDENDVIDDSYFEFDNVQLTRIDIEVNNKRNGVRILETCGNLPTEVPIDVLMDANKGLTASTITTGTTSPQEERVKAMTKAIDSIADAQSSGASTIDVPTVKLNFLLDLIKNFMKSIINIIISPKLMTLFSLNFKILYGATSEYDGPIDFMKKNKNLITSIAKTVLEPIITMLISMVLKRLTAMIAKKLSGDKIEQAKNYVAQLLSMLGVPQEIIRQIQGLI
jgi:hypothetical protein